jgi:hypothetical protein
MTVSGTVLPAGETEPRRRARGRNLGVSVELPKPPDGDVYIHFQHEFASDPRFIRGLLKIALSSVAYFDPSGGVTVLDPCFDAVRDFVVHGRGTRPVAVIAASDLKYWHYVHPPFKTSDGHPWCYLRLGMAEFFVDLSERCDAYPRLLGELERLKPGEAIVLPRFLAPGAA